MFDDEIEKALLYYIIFQNEDYLLDSEDFVNLKHKKIINAINDLKSEKKEITILNINNKIKDNNNNFLEYLADLGTYIRIHNSNELYNTLIENSKKRKTIQLIQKTISDLNDIDNIDIHNQILIKELIKISEINSKEKTFVQQVIETVEQIEKNITVKEDYKLYTGMIDLDEITCGLHNQELTIIGARPRNR